MGVLPRKAQLPPEHTGSSRPSNHATLFKRGWWGKGDSRKSTRRVSRVGEKQGGSGGKGRRSHRGHQFSSNHRAPRSPVWGTPLGLACLSQAYPSPSPPPPILFRSCCQIWPKLPPPCPLSDGSPCSQPSPRAPGWALGPSAPRPSLLLPLSPATFRDVFPPEIPGPRPLPGGAQAAPRGTEGRPGPPALPATSAHRRPVAHPATPAWRPAPLPVLFFPGSAAAAAAAASGREGPARPPRRPLGEPQERGTPQRTPPPSEFGLGLEGPSPAGGGGAGTRGGISKRGRRGAGLPSRQGLRLSQVFQEGRRWFQGGARNPRGGRVYTDPELTSGPCLHYASGQARNEG